MATGGNNNRPGLAFFFVNPIMDGSGCPGWSGDSDLDNFVTIFGRKLGFEWVNKQFNRNITLGMWNHERDNSYNPGVRRDQCCIMCLMKSKDYSDVGSILLGISAHGGVECGSQCVQLHDNHMLPVSDIMEDLSDAKFPQLKGKNRILVIDCCRSDPSNPERAEDRGAKYSEQVDELGSSSISSSTEPIPEVSEGAEDGGEKLRFETLNISSTTKATPYESDIQRQSGEGMRNSKSQNRDFFVIYSTTPGRFSFTRDSTGSWLLHSLKQVIDTHVSPRLNLLHALTKTASIMAKEETNNPNDAGLKSILCISHTLTSLQHFTIQSAEALPNVSLV